MVSHVTTASATPLAELPSWVTLVRAPNPGPMTLDGTNTWLLRAPGQDAAVVVDPGPLIESHLATVAGRGPVATVLTTHGHPDHVEGLDRFVELTAAARTPPPLEVGGVEVTTIVTPGHTADSVCFLARYRGETVLLSGDTILGRGTTVVAYPDGDLGRYLDSLRILRGYEGVPVLPGHGPALLDTATAATFYLEHRLARLEQVRSAVAAGAHTPEDVVAVVYADVDRVLWPAAELSVRAQLAYLQSDSGESDNHRTGLDRP